MKTLSEFFKHQATGTIIGIIGVSMGVIFYMLSIKNIEPKYAVRPSELLAEVTNDTERLKLLWDEKEISNIYSIKILFWNDGRKFLDKNDISTTSPLKITIPPDIDILFHQFVKTSRDDLKMESEYRETKNTKDIYINIIGDEALEAGDGGIVQILYSGEKTSDFFMKGRIKGVKYGIEMVDWATYHPLGESVNAWTKYSILAALIFLPVSFFWAFVERYRTFPVEISLQTLSISLIGQLIFNLGILFTLVAILYRFLIRFIFAIDWVS